MDWQTAVKVLATKDTGEPSSLMEEAIAFITEAINDQDHKGDYASNPVGSKGLLRDWIAIGAWYGDETLEQIQEEWDEQL